jgi:uncharacterized protein with HXXEE motif
VDRLAWAPLAAASLHIFEEFAWPGGFADWYRRYMPSRAKSITPRFLIIINTLLLILCYDAGAAYSRSYGAVLWLAVAALLAGNAIWHIVGTLKTRSYSPGIVTGVALYLPMALFGLVRLLNQSKTTVSLAFIAAVAGGSYHWWSAALHRRRANRNNNPG